MGEIILVRHGQANSHATSEVEYDRLSDLGHMQAKWLGAWMRDHEKHFDHVLSGTLRRQRETAAGLGFDPDTDARLNEIDYYGLTESLNAVKGEPYPTQDSIHDHMHKIFAAWAAAEIEGSETYQAFEDRIGELLAEAAQPGRRVLCVTSGGVIGMVLRQVLDLPLMKLAQVVLPVFNTSMHRLRVHDGATVLAGYNAIPHLEPPARAHARTHI